MRATSGGAPNRAAPIGSTALVGWQQTKNQYNPETAPGARCPPLTLSSISWEFTRRRERRRLHLREYRKRPPSNRRGLLVPPSPHGSPTPRQVEGQQRAEERKRTRRGVLKQRILYYIGEEKAPRRVGHRSPISFLSETVSSPVSLVPTNAADRKLRFIGFCSVFSTCL
jgi:hypothetical protein